MSRIELDDLVASFSGQHIGQEQIDLANLQAQLRLSLPAAMTASTPSPLQTPRNYQYHHQPISSAYPGLPIHHTSTSFSSSSSIVGTNTSPISTPTQTMTTAMPHHAWNNSPSFPKKKKIRRSCTQGGVAANTSATTSATTASTTSTRNLNRNENTPSDWDEMEEVDEELDNGGGSESMDSQYDYYEIQHQQHQQQQQQQQHQGYHHHHHHSHYTSHPGYGYNRPCALPLAQSPTSSQQSNNPSSSSFTTSDPFYLATLRNTQVATASTTTGPASSGFLRPAIGFATSFPTSY